MDCFLARWIINYVYLSFTCKFVIPSSTFINERSDLWFLWFRTRTEQSRYCLLYMEPRRQVPPPEWTDELRICTSNFRLSLLFELPLSCTGADTQSQPPSVSRNIVDFIYFTTRVKFYSWVLTNILLLIVWTCWFQVPEIQL